MKKNIIKVAFVAAFAMIAGYGIYTAKTQTNLSDIILDNSEAIAAGESDKSPCGGPKGEYGCQSTNTIGCKDTSGCQ